MKRISLFVVCFIVSLVSLLGQNISGSWNGELSIQGVKLPIVFNVNNDKDSLIVTMDSPMQGAKGIPTTYSKFANNQLSLKAIQLMLQYDGVLSGDSVIDGVFMQGGVSFPLKLIKNNTKINRPQEPLAPFPYNSEDVVFENQKEKIKLAGTFTYPKNGSNFPSVVLITGSGSQNRNEEIFGHKPFLVLSDYLTRNGIAVLRFDDRGIGDSEGNAKIATTKDLSIDVRAAIEYIKSRSEIAQDKIGLIGHSEGGTIAFMLASEYDDISFIVSMGGGAIRGDSLLREQRRMISSVSGIGSEMFEKNELLITKIQNFIDGKNEESLKEDLDQFMENELMPIMSTLPSQYIPSKNVLKGEVLKMALPWMQYFMKYDPTLDIGKIKCPIFAVNGSKDLQVKASSNLDSIKKYAPHAVVKEYEGLNHLFQTCKTGAISEYGEIEETISDIVLADICNWIKLTTKSIY